MSLHIVLVLLTLTSGAVAILATYYLGRPIVFYVTKPLTTILILLPVLVLVPKSTTPYVPLIGGGLIFALVGDVFLMLSEDRFVLGIASFAITHVLYLAAFVVAAGLALINPLVIPLVIYAVLMSRFIWPGVPRGLRAPVLLYVVLITAMASQGIGSAIVIQSTALALVGAGAIIFLASDSLLAINRFRLPFRAAQAFVLSTYWVAQWMIALSARQPGW